MEEKIKIIYLFYDGIGIGEKNSDTNPFTRYASSYLSALGGNSPRERLKDWHMIPTDAQLGVDGLPQSATGQTSLWTGINAQKFLGYHFTGRPGPTLVKLIWQYSILKKVREHKLCASFLNAYNDIFLAKIQKNTRLQSASYHAQAAAGLAHLSLDDLEKNQALYMDYTHEIMHKMYPELEARFPKQKAYQRGRDLARMALNYDLSLHEFFITDKAGHNRSWEMAQWCIQTIEDFLAGLVSALDPQKQLLLISSDHGNMEDFSTKTHTINLVPSFAYGKFAEKAAKRIHCITDIAKLIYDLLGIEIDWDSYGELSATSSQDGHNDAQN